jgi:hypothetical protein
MSFEEVRDQIRDYGDTPLELKLAKAVGKVLGEHRMDPDKSKLFLRGLLYIFSCEEPCNERDRLEAEFEDGYEEGRQVKGPGR